MRSVRYVLCLIVRLVNDVALILLKASAYCVGWCDQQT